MCLPLIAALAVWLLARRARRVAEAVAAARGTPPEGAAPGAQASPAPLKLPLTDLKIVVSKSKRLLTLFSDGRVVRVYRIALGANPSGDKEREGDGRTPEGEFYVCVKNGRSNFYLSLGLSYPGREDAERGLRDRLVTRVQYRRIVAAATRKRRPPWDTALGGEIFIHGGGTSNDWTAGCVALDNPDMRELFDSVPLGTPVSITP